jgi:hypothetical protein
VPRSREPLVIDLPTPLTRRRRRRTRVLFLCGLVMPLGLLLLALRTQEQATPETAVATSAAVPVMNVGPVIVAEPSAPTPLPIQVGPPEAVPRQAWLRISGLPAMASLSQGYALELGLWKLPLDGLYELAITAPSEGPVRSRVSIALMSADGAVLAAVESVLVVVPASSFLAGGNSTLRAGLTGVDAGCPDAVPDALR